MPEYEEGGQPWARASSEPLFCPFCGSRKLKLSDGDIPGDSLRIEFYCDNSYCDVRELAVIALRTNRPQVMDRADVLALWEVDQGTEAERGPDTVDMMSRMELERLSLYSEQVLYRRQRPTRITVEPLDE